MRTAAAPAWRRAARFRRPRRRVRQAARQRPGQRLPVPSGIVSSGCPSWVIVTSSVNGAYSVVLATIGTTGRRAAPPSACLRSERSSANASGTRVRSNPETAARSVAGMPTSGSRKLLLGPRSCSSATGSTAMSGLTIVGRVRRKARSTSPVPPGAPPALEVSPPSLIVRGSVSIEPEKSPVPMSHRALCRCSTIDSRPSDVDAVRSSW